MSAFHTVARASATALLIAASACSGTGGLGSVLGSVLGGGAQQGGQASGYVQGVDTRSQQLYLQQSNGQTLTVGYDANTQVIYQNQRYNVTSLERGDQVTVRIQSTNNGAYYTDYVQVDQSVSSSVGSTSQGVQRFQGTVRQIDQNNGVLLMDLQNGGRLTVQLMPSLRRADIDHFRSLRVGDYVQFSGTYLSNSRAELQQFY
jgi:hypothetical protein